MRSQASTTFIMFVMIEIIMVVMFAFAASKTLKDVNVIYEERFLARDLALLIDSFADHPVVFLYGFYEYDNDLAVEAYNDELGKQASSGLGKAYAVVGLATSFPSVLRPLVAWGLGRGYLATLGEEESILQKFSIETGKVVSVKRLDSKSGESYPYVNREALSAKGKSLLRFVYEPGRLRLDTLENEKIVWNPYRKTCKPVTVNLGKVALDGSEDMAKLLITLKGLLERDNIEVLLLLDEEDKEELIKEQDAYISIVASERPGMRILHTTPKACEVYNELTDLYSRDVEGAALLPVHPAQYDPTHPFFHNPAIEIQLGPPDLFIDNPREVAHAIAQAFP